MNTHATQFNIYMYVVFIDTGMTSVSSVIYAIVPYNQTASLHSIKTRHCVPTATQPITKKPATVVVVSSIQGGHDSSTVATIGTRSASSARPATRRLALAVLCPRITSFTVLLASRTPSLRGVRGVASPF